MRIMLAPMEGVLDAFMRELLTKINDYDLCVTEFMRVVNTRLPAKTFYRLCPELQQQGYTSAGTPVRVQLLGSSPHWMAENAAYAIELGSHGIDINCGCPAKKVVGSEGGASLLKNPELIYQVTQAVRQAVPPAHPVSVKIRLGWNSINERFEIADAAQQGGASELVVHGRTKEDGYRAEQINWSAIGDIQKRLTIPVIANGEIWNYDDGRRCLQQTGCQDLMVARSALNTPNLSTILKHNAAPLPWQDVVLLLQHYVKMENPYDSGFYHLARIKQWLSYLKKNYPQAQQLFATIRTMNDTVQLSQHILSI